MKCSLCKLEGYNKNNCPRCKEKNEEKINRLLEILPTETVFVALSYVSLSQLLQKTGTAADLLGTGSDLLALKHPDPGIFLGGIMSLGYESLSEDWIAQLMGMLEGAAKTVTETGGKVLDPMKTYDPVSTVI